MVAYEIGLTSDQIMGMTMRCLINMIEAYHRREIERMHQFEMLFMSYCAMPEYATHCNSDSKLKSIHRKIVQNPIFELPNEMKKTHLSADDIESLAKLLD